MQLHGGEAEHMVGTQVLVHEPLPNRLSYMLAVARIVGGTFIYVAGNLCATKQVHIKHHRLKIGGASFWWDSGSF